MLIEFYRYIKTEKGNNSTRALILSLPSKVHIVNFQFVSQCHIGIMEEVRQSINEDFHAMVSEQIDKNILSFE